MGLCREAELPMLNDLGFLVEMTLKVDRSKGLEFPNDQYVTKFLCLKLRLPFESVARRVNQLLVIYMRSNTLSAT